MMKTDTVYYDRSYNWVLLLVIVGCAVMGHFLHADTYYVDRYSPVDGPGTAWTNAYRIMQDAVDAASDGDLVLVTNGVYNSGGRVQSGYYVSNRVMISKAIEVRSVNGPDVTSIEGKNLPPNRSVRCLFLGGGARFSGFTLTKGYSTIGPSPTFDKSGGGALIRSGTILSNCIITGCESILDGGGIVCANGGIVTDCTIKDNDADEGEGGGIIMQEGGLAVRCMIRDNTAEYGGGVSCFEGGSLSNCVVARNEATVETGGIYAYYGGPVVNCTICYNTAATNGGGTDGVGLDTYRCGNVRNNLFYRNTWQGNEFDMHLGSTSADYNRAVPAAGSHCITNVPSFVSDGNRNYRLLPGSAGIDAGNDAYAALPVDLDLNPRINNIVDLGAYEYYPVSVDITNANTLVYYNTMAFTIGGTNSSNVSGTMGWTNTLNGSNGSFAAVSPWMIDNIPLAVGDNVIVVRGDNGNGISGSDTVTVTRTWEDGGDSPTHYVWTNSPSPAWPFTNWTTAAHVLQEGVSTASSNDTVWVTNGVYDAGGEVVFGYELTNRVLVGSMRTVRSVNGPSKTFIMGNGPQVAAAVRCAYMMPGAILDGFTLTNGHCLSSGLTYDRRGGGVYFNGGGTVTNCVVTGCEAYNAGGMFFSNGGYAVSTTIKGNSADSGGGLQFRDDGLARWCRIENNEATRYEAGGIMMSGGMLDHCEVIGNSATNGAGGGIWATHGTLTNCLIAGNVCSGNGGGIFGQMLEAVVNCTIVDNEAGGEAGGFWISQCDDVYNNIIYSNTASANINWRQNSSTIDYSCTIPTVGSNCMTNEPLFVDAAGGNYRLQAASPCVNTGNNAYATMAYDLDGFQRIAEGTVDLGAYEYIPWPVIVITNDDDTVVYQTTTYTIGGWKSTSVVGLMGWSNALTGAGGAFSSVSPWSVVDIALDVGNNMITVWGSNSGGATTSDTVTITRTWEDAGDSPVHYVAPGGADTWPYTNWVQAGHNLQDVVEAAMANDTVLVSNGVYDAGGMLTPGYALTNRVMINKAIAMRSLNGTPNTFIVGASDNGTNGPAAVRCVYLAGGAEMSGFTVTNGHTLFGGGDDGKCGGGIYIENGTVSNCIATGNSAHHGGGMGISYSGGTILHSEMVNNTADAWAGGLLMLGSDGRTERCLITGNHAEKGGGTHLYHGSTLRNSLLTENISIDEGGGVYLNDGGRLENCTLADNISSNRGGGIYFFATEGTSINCIVYGNMAPDGSNYYKNGGGAFLYSCTSPDSGETGCITDDPLFVGGGDYRLGPVSPAVDAGTNLMDIVDDLDGTPRPLDGNNDGTNTMDMGSYEYVSMNADSDGDSMIDEWELGHALDPLNPADAPIDDDGDEYRNDEEFVADTNPWDSNSFFHVTGIDDTASCVVSFVCTNSREYSLSYATNLMNGVWVPVEGATNATGVGSSMSLTDTVESVQRSYRVGVNVP